MNPDAADLFAPLSTADSLVIQASLAAPWLGVIAAIVLLSSIALFAFRSREPGRFEILAGTTLFVAEFVYFMHAYHELALGGGLVREAWMRLLGVLPLVLVAIGFARLAWSHARQRPD